MFDTELAAIGLTDNQRSVYVAILGTGKTTPARLSAMTGINRTTVYAVCKELAQKGFVDEDTLKGTTYYYPVSTKDLLKITKRERQALIEKELTIAELAKSIDKLPQSKTYAVPKIRFVEHEEKVEEFLYDRVAVWRASDKTGNPDWYGFQDHSLVEHEVFGKWIQWYWKSYPETQLYLLSNDAEIETKMTDEVYANRSIKFWKKGFDFTETQWIVGDYSIMIMSREKPYYAVELHDAVYADNMRKLFKNLWEEIK